MLLFSEAGQTCLCQDQQNAFCEIIVIDPNSDFRYVPQSTVSFLLFPKDETFKKNVDI